jgi:hypothetical protein
MSFITAQMHALGSYPLPEVIPCSGRTYALSAVLKHDFFAATGMYRLNETGHPAPECIILKINRRAPFFGLPLGWLGSLLTGHELGMIRRLAGIRGIPQVLARYQSSGFIYEYIPGLTIDHKPPFPGSFFGELRELVDDIHRRNVVYVDMNKRGNIILGEDGRPHLIDFQISLHLPGPLFSPLRSVLRRSDLYHLYKHKRRLVPEMTSDEEYILSRRKGPLLFSHWLLTEPYRRARRKLFRFLYSRGLLSASPDATFSHENDPRRFLRKSSRTRP